jgi:hypothetical protein
MHRILITAILLIQNLLVLAQTDDYSLNTCFNIEYSDLKSGFQTPPSGARLRCYWWWLNGMATKESITRDLEEMKAKGYGGAAIVDAGSSNYQVAGKTPAGPVFMSPAWMELYQHAVREADRLGIALTVNLGSGWNPGGPSITPEFAMKKLVYSETSVSGGKQIKITLAQPENNLYYKDIAVQAIPKRAGEKVKNEAIKDWDIKSFNKPIGWKGIYPLYKLRDDYPGDGVDSAIKISEIIDITACFKNGELTWNAPAGDWIVIRYGYTCTGAKTSTNSDGWEGLSLDHLSVAAFNLFSKNVTIPLIETAQKAGKSLKFVQTDSWEMDDASWTALFPDDFKKFRGYSILKYLPVLTGRIVENRNVTNRFLHDFRLTVGDCVLENHYRLLYNLAHKYGLGMHPESGGPHSAPVDALRTMGISDYPQGEFWAMSNSHRVKDDERLSVRQSACAAHTNGKRIVAAEGPTSIGPQWERSPMDLKGNIDRVYCSGINRIEWHTFTSSPKEFGLPGNEYFAGTHLNPNVTWWNQAGNFISYLNRCGYMLQQGLFVADVLYYYGDDVPDFVFLKEELPELKRGFDWDKCSKDVILTRASVANNRIVLPDGMSYRLLMLAPEKEIDLAVLKKIEKLVLQGMVLYGPKPLYCSGLSGYSKADAEVSKIVANLWGNIDGHQIREHVYGLGKVIWGDDINTVLANLNIGSDFTFKSNKESVALDYIHRTTGKQEIYFVTNRFSRNGYNDFLYRYMPVLPDRYEQVECHFRVTGKQPEIWDPITGETTKILTWEEENGETIIPLHFEPEGSKFIVFTSSLPEKHIVEIIKDDQHLFPDGNIESGPFPVFSAFDKNQQWSATFRTPGSYYLKWSDGNYQKIIVNRGISEMLLTGSWILHFDTKWGGPENIEIDTLKSWTEFKDEGIKYYSGTAVYSKSFNLDENISGNQILLDLGYVGEMASLKINGHSLPVKWCAPFQFDITSYALSGENKIEIEVTNLWCNRLIGDSKLPEEKRFTKTNIMKFNAPKSEKFLKSSGISGPVKIIFLEKKNLTPKV